MAKRAVVSIPMDLLGKLLQMPEGVEVLHVVVGNYGLSLDLVITAPDMAEVEEGIVPPRANVNYVIEGGHPWLTSVAYPSQGPAGGAE